MNLTNYIPTIAKAVAAFLTPFIVLGLGWVIERTGVDLPYNPDAIQTGVVAILTAIATWAISNRPAPAEGERDRGSISLMDVLVVLMIVAVIVWLLRVL